MCIVEQIIIDGSMYGGANRNEQIVMLWHRNIKIALIPKYASEMLARHWHKAAVSLMLVEQYSTVTPTTMK